MRLFTSIFILLLFTATNAGAEIVVLVHGFKSSSQDWYNSGVIDQLQNQGWRPGGHYRYYPQGVMGPASRAEGENLIYTVDLPNTAPVMLQVGYLHAVLQSIEAIAPKDTLNLVGHSAGGVVARAVMVIHPEHTIARLITIAAPHLGSSAASVGSLVASTPLSMMADMLGQDELAHSGQLLSELSPPTSGNFLFWLNQQPHPPALHYISLVRTNNPMFGGDNLVSPQSQDLRNVVNLGSRAVSYSTPGSHSLQAQDGDLIGHLLMQP
ncbi:MAG: hypothetical protein DSZ28_09840 [Thiothrix sp.]|nr:MAG: hypothetical protein DSZ28_09840 [Thiothrix sp.]